MCIWYSIWQPKWIKRRRWNTRPKQDFFILCVSYRFLRGHSSFRNVTTAPVPVMYGHVTHKALADKLNWINNSIRISSKLFAFVLSMVLLRFSSEREMYIIFFNKNSRLSLWAQFLFRLRRGRCEGSGCRWPQTFVDGRMKCFWYWCCFRSRTSW